LVGDVARPRNRHTAGVDEQAFAGHRAAKATQLELVATSPVTPPAPGGPDERLRSLSVSSLVQLARCPKQFYWSAVRPLPRRPSAAARLGQEIHRWIEIRSLGQQRLGDPEQWADLAPDEVRDDVERGGPEALKRAFEASPYANLRPRFVEQPFVVALRGGYLVRGRMDAVHVRTDETWEIVDYKTGARPAASDEVNRLQLGIYALAAARIWSVDRARLDLSYFYLRSGEIVTSPAAEAGADESQLVRAFEALADQPFEPTPSELCFSCDFLRFCGAGRAYVAERRAGEG
jgi:PD-(D/E)XK nuclease superfamily